MTRQIPPTHEKVRSALSHVSADVDRANWVRILAAIKDALDEAGRDIADEWSQGGASYDRNDFRDTWKSIKTGGKVTVGTLFYLAKQSGWTPDAEAREETAEEREERERQRQARGDKAAKKKARKERQAAAKAAALWKAAAPARPDHPYLNRKRIEPIAALREIEVEPAAGILGYAPQSDGEPLAGRLLLVPVKTGGKLATLEMIDEAGRKAAIAGGPKSGGFWAAQGLPKGDGAGLVVAVGEGVATVLSCRKATAFSVLAALSASNLPKIAGAIRERYPAASMAILGDIGGGLKYAEQAARATGAALAVPDFSGLDAGEKDTDFNDLHRLAGLDAVRGQITKALADRPDTGDMQTPVEKTEGTGRTKGTATADAASGGSLDNLSRGTEGTKAGDGADKPEVPPRRADGQTDNRAVPMPMEKSEGTGGTQGTFMADGASSGSLGFSTEGTEGTRTAVDGTGPKRGKVLPFPGAGDSGKNPPKGNGAPPGSTEPDEPVRPSYVVREEWSRYGPPGVWFHGYRNGGKAKDPEPLNLHLCSPLYVEAVTCTDDGRSFGRFLKFQDTFGRWRTWAMPMEMLRGSCEEVRGELLTAGVLIEYQERARLADYLQWKTPERRITAAIRTGWTRDGTAFVLPETVIGSEDVYFQSESMHVEGTAEAGGEFETWKTEIAARCIGNPVLALSLCVALAGPLLAKVQRDSGGIHWVGDSSTGKSTALNVGCSVWGSETFRRTWRATANGLEGAAAGLSDTCLCLDEINEADPREIGSIVYALGNGTGKTRANRIGSARQVFRWRLTLLSTGERTLAAQMAEGNKQPKAGQLVRLLNIPAGRAFGVFDELHGFPTGRALADHLKTVCGRHYGHAGPAFIAALVKDGRDFGEALAAVEALPPFQADSSQEARAASRFALYGMAGELAQEWGILPWPEGEALRAAAEGFRLWREARGGGSTEDRQILQAVLDFISRHGDSRFSRKAGDEEDQPQPVVMQRAGWWIDLDDDGGRVYLFTAEALREATKGHDFKRALDALDLAGWIHDRDRNQEGKRSKKTAIGPRKLWLYWILPGDLNE